MTVRRTWILLFLLTGLCTGILCPTGQAKDASLEEAFLSPPDSAKPHTWWHWMHGNVTKEGITADLEAMRRVGIGGFQAFHVTDRMPPGPVGYMSDSWRELMAHTIREADRLGLEVCLHNCAGWSSSGGPWITPELAMQEVVWSEMRLQGPKHISEKCPRPKTTLEAYWDIAILALPLPEGNTQTKAKKPFRIQDWKTKAGFDRKKNRPERDTRHVPPAEIVHSDRILDLTKSMDGSGTLTWEVPEGRWLVLRFGYTPTGKTNHPAPEEGCGLECDKLSREAAEFHWKHSMQKVIDDVGSLAGKTFNSVLIDSYEVRHQNWTHGFEKDFRKRLGYDPLPYLPCLTGRVVDSLNRSERFLWDFRRLIADVIAERYFGHFAEMCERHGMVLSIEPYGRSGNFDDFAVAARADIPMGEWWARMPQRWHHWSGKLASSGAHAYGRRFVGAEAFTAGGPSAAYVNHPYFLKAQGDYFYCQGVNRFIFHTFAHQPWMDLLPGMTMGPHGFQHNRNNTWFEKGRAWLKYLARCQVMLQEGQFVADLCYLADENAPNTMDVREEMRPTPPLGYDYDAFGRDVFMQLSAEDGKLLLPSGMTYRILVLPEVNRMRPLILRKLLELVQAGAVVYGSRPLQSPSLEGYPECDKEVQEMADKIWGPGKGDVDSGRSVCGKGIVFWGTPLTEVLKELNIAEDFVATSSLPAEGTLYTGTGVETIHRQKENADWYFVSNQHEKRNTVTATFRIQGRVPELWDPVEGRIEDAPLWVLTGDGRIQVSLPFSQAGSVFVVFKRPAKGEGAFVSVKRDGKSVWEDESSAPSAELHIQDGATVLTAWQEGAYQLKTASGETLETTVRDGPASLRMDGPWEIRFPEGWGAPSEIKLDTLQSWTEHENQDVKHFSGTATYLKEFDLSEDLLLEHCWRLDLPEDVQVIGRCWRLDLGDVQVIAEVKLNGKDLGILWKPPFVVDVTDFVKAGRNQLEVEVTNLWPNRLIGDAALPDDVHWVDTGRHGKGIAEIPAWLLEGKQRPDTERKTFTTWRHYEADSPLLPSGLLGPVRLVPGVKIKLR